MASNGVQLRSQWSTMGLTTIVDFNVVNSNLGFLRVNDVYFLIYTKSISAILAGFVWMF